MAIQIQDFRPFKKNTLQGFVTIRLTNIGLEIRDCPVHESAGKRWIQMPSKPYQKKDGEQTFAFILDFYDKPKGKQFQELALEALDAFRERLKI